MCEVGRQRNMLDGGAHYYDTYRCADGKYVSIGSIEPQFYALLIEKLGVDLDAGDFMAQFDKAKWPGHKQVIADRISEKTCAEWCQIMEGSDVCFAPVLDMNEAPRHPHNKARNSFVELNGIVQTAPAPRFSETPGKIQGAPVAPGSDTRAVLSSLGLDVDALIAAGAVNQLEAS